MTIFARRLMQQDWQDFFQLRLTALKECPGVYGSNFGKESQYTPDEWQNILKPEGQAVFGLYENENLIGITAVATDWGNAEAGVFWGSYIKPEYRGRGLSDFLYNARIEWGKKHLPWKKLLVGHRDGNEASRRANQRHGFVFTRKESQAWPDGSTADHLYYELDLERLRKKE